MILLGKVASGGRLTPKVAPNLFGIAVARLGPKIGKSPFALGGRWP
jgi:hypothetical protein